MTFGNALETVLETVCSETSRRSPVISVGYGRSRWQIHPFTPSTGVQIPLGTPKRKSGTYIKKCKCLFLFAANLLLTTRVFGAKIFPCSHRKGAALHVTGCMPPHPPSPPPALPFSGNPLSELFPFRSRRESNHTACRFTKKRGFFRLIWAEGRVLPPRVLATPTICTSRYRRHIGKTSVSLDTVR